MLATCRPRGFCKPPPAARPAICRDTIGARIGPQRCESQTVKLQNGVVPVIQEKITGMALPLDPPLHDPFFWIRNISMMQKKAENTPVREGQPTVDLPPHRPLFLDSRIAFSMDSNPTRRLPESGAFKDPVLWGRDTMKITKDELAGTTEASPMELFRQGIRAEETLCKYTSTLKRMLCDVLEDILEGTFEQRAAQLVREGKANPDRMRDILLISKKQRGRTCLPRDDPDYFNPSSAQLQADQKAAGHERRQPVLEADLRHLPGDRQRGRVARVDQGRDTHDAQVLRRPHRADHVLVAASSGMRLGGFDLKWDHIRPIYRVGGRPGRLSLGGNGTGTGTGNDAELVCATISVYSGTDSAYPAFITPEAYAALQDYAQLWEQEVGRAPKPDNPVFKRVGGCGSRGGHISTQEAHRQDSKKGGTAGCNPQKRAQVRRAHHERFQEVLEQGLQGGLVPGLPACIAHQKGVHDGTRRPGQPRPQLFQDKDAGACGVPAGHTRPDDGLVRGAPPGEPRLGRGDTQAAGRKGRPHTAP